MRIGKLLLFAQILSNSLHLPPQVQGKPSETAPPACSRLLYLGGEDGERCEQTMAGYKTLDGMEIENWDEYLGKLITVFKPALLDSMRVSHLLCLIDIQEVRDKAGIIHHKENKWDYKGATAELLRAIEISDQRGKWQMFLDALKEATGPKQFSQAQRGDSEGQGGKLPDVPVAAEREATCQCRCCAQVLSRVTSLQSEQDEMKALLRALINQAPIHMP